MAQQKWIKWIVGLTGVALFSGFVGLLSNDAKATADTSGQSAGASGGSIDQNDDDVTNQWQSQTQDVPGGGFGRRGAGRMGGLNGGSGMDGQNEFGGQGSMRTHAS